MSSPTRHHTVTIEFDGDNTPTATMKCTAPADALCHATNFDCQCEEWDDDGVDDGRPWHQNEGSERHYGELDPSSCGFTDWFDGNTENLTGDIAFPVEPNWQGDYYLFDAVDAPAAPQVETLDIPADVTR